MKKTISLIAFCVIVSLGASAQVFRIGTGVGFGGGSNSVGLSLNLLELGYAPTAKMEYGAYLGSTVSVSGSSTSGSASGGTRYGVQGKYYFREEGFKPYAGLQVGLLSGVSGTTSTTSNSSTATAGTKFDVAPMVGFRVGPLNINAAYQSGVKLNLGLLFGFGDFN